MAVEAAIPGGRRRGIGFRQDVASDALSTKLVRRPATWLFNGFGPVYAGTVFGRINLLVRGGANGIKKPETLTLSDFLQPAS